MRISIWTILFILLLNSPASARLGETLEKCRLRYDEPIHGPVEENDHLLARYKWQTYFVTILFENEVAVEIHYTMQDDTPIPTYKISDLLRENPSVKRPGTIIKGLNTWYIHAIDPEKNRVIYAHKNEIAAGYYDVEEKELVLTLTLTEKLYSKFNPSMIPLRFPIHFFLFP